MKLDPIYSEQEVEILDVKKTIKFGFDENAQQMIFKMFSKNIYSNPIGSVVREITSNCFDSHIEANVTDPVILKLTNVNNQQYISFIDVGVGMSPERVEKQYASAFSSTKRNDNYQIGGFGVGSMSLLAYAESYFLTTIYNGVEYVYNIRKGTNQPEADLLSKHKTTKRNGSIVKLPIRGNDVHVFEKEILRQLYYFENVIFEGFSGTVKNEYRIIEGKNFLYRGKDQNQYAHICLGRVAYPIDFSVLEDNSGSFYSGDWNVPVAIKMNIGEINVTVSREAIDYTEATKKLIKKKLLAIKTELICMLEVQYEKLETLEDFYRMENNPSNLFLTKDETINIGCLTDHRQPVVLMFNALDIPCQNEVVQLFYDVSMLGKKGRRDRTWDKSVKSIANENVYFLNKDEAQPSKKNAFMKHTYKYFYTIKRSTFSISQLKLLVKKLTNETVCADSKIVFKQFRELVKEVFKLVEKNVKKYESITVPDGFKVNSGRTYDPNYELPVTFDGKHNFNKERMKMSGLENTKATLYYGDLSDESMMQQYSALYRAFFVPKYEFKFRIGDGDYRGFPIRFIMVSKSNLRYITELKNAKPMIEFEKVLVRKREAVIKQIEKEMFLSRYNMQNELFMNEKVFSAVDKDYAKKVKALKDMYKSYAKVATYNVTTSKDNLLLSILKIDRSQVNYKGHDLFAAIETTTEKNGMLAYVRIHKNFDPTDKKSHYGEKEIDNILQLFKLAYVK